MFEQPGGGKKNHKRLAEVWLGYKWCICIVCVSRGGGDGVCSGRKESKGCQRGREKRGSYSHKLTAAGWGAASFRLPLKLKSIAVKSNEEKKTLASLLFLSLRRGTQILTCPNLVQLSRSPFFSSPTPLPLSMHFIGPSSHISPGLQLVKQNKGVSA